MSLTIQQILQDAKKLSSKLKEHDSAADVILSQTQSVYKKIDAMKQYQESAGELNDVARQRPHTQLVAGMQQESRRLRELQHENRELRAALDDHQNTLELIMSKYRQQVSQLVNNSRQDLSALHSQQYAQVIVSQADKINEMAGVMRLAATVDDESTSRDEQTITRLTTENQGLRELLNISVKYGSTSETEKEEKPNDCSEDKPKEL